MSYTRAAPHRRTAPGPSAGRQEGEVAQDVVHGLGQVARFATSLQFSPEAPTEVIAWSAPCTGRLQ